MNVLKKILNILKHPVAILIIIAAVFLMSYLLYIWNGYPRGIDAISHLFRVKTMVEFWPHFNWIQVWAGGMPGYLFYPVVPYLIMSGIFLITKLPLMIVITIGALLTVILVTCGVYLIVYRLTRNWFTALMAVFLYVSAPAAFSYPFAGGAYGRPFGLLFFVLALFSAIIFFQNIEEKKWSKISFFFTVIFLGLSIISHPITGAVGFTIIFLLGLIVKVRFWEKIKLIFKIYILAILLSAIFIFPFILLMPTQVEIDVQGFLSKLVSIPWSRLIYLFDYNQEIIWTTEHLRTLTPFLIPLAVILWIFALLFRRQQLQINNFKIRLLILFSLLSLFFLIYAKYVVSFLFSLYSSFGSPGAAPLYLAFFLSLTIAILWSIVWKHKILSRIMALILIIIIGFWAKIQFLEIKNVSDVARISQKEFIAFNSTTKEVLKDSSQLVRLVIKDKNQFNFRFGTADDAGLAMWFNLEYPYVPQTRDYFSPAILNVDDYVYNYISIWRWNENYPETSFNMDWWAVKQFIVNQKGETKDKYYSQPNYQRLDFNHLYDIFEFKNTTPILSATNIPSVLVIGKEKVNYDTIFRSLAQGNLNSHFFIPIIGKENIDDYNLSELQKFQTVFLYGYKWKNQKKAEKLLTDFVKKGGGLFIEANRDANTEILDIFPVVDSANSAFGKEFKIKEGDQTIIKDIDYNKFSEAIYDDKPWGMVQANEAKDSATTIINNYGKPVVVSEKIGNGRIIWSGMNLPYHTLMYKNEEEAKLLGQLLDWTTQSENKNLVSEKPILDKDLVYETESYKTEFINSEERIVTIKKPVSGILFKENYFQNWRAKTAGQNLQIYPAGPKFMYVPLPDDIKEGDQIIFEYKKKFWPEKFSMIISLLTFLGLIFYVLGGKLFKPLLDKIRSRINEPIKRTSEMSKRWWEEDENDY